MELYSKNLNRGMKDALIALFMTVALCFLVGLLMCLSGCTVTTNRGIYELDGKVTKQIAESYFESKYIHEEK